MIPNFKRKNQRLQWGKRFATKMILALLVVILIPTLTSVLFYSASSKLVKKNVRVSSLQLVRQAADALSSIITAGTDASNVLYSDTKLQQAVRNTKPSPEEEQANDDYISNLVNNFVGSNSFVNTLYILREDAPSWGSGSFKLSKIYRQPLRDLEWVKLARLKDGKPAWGPLAYDPYSGIGESNDLVVPVTRVIKDFESLADIGYLLVNLDGKKIVDRIGQIHLGKTGGFYVVDDKGTIVIDGRLERVGKPLSDSGLREWASQGSDAEFEYEADGIRYYNIKQPLSNRWSVIGSVPIHEITDELTSMRRMIWTSAVGFALLAILIGLLLARQVTKPIKQLTSQMKVAESGDFTVRTEVRSQDEIGHMSRQFNKMIKRIDELVQEVHNVQESKKQAELRAVTHRIHPHFLFNTLSTIKWLVRYNQSSKAYEALSALVLLLEANMGKKGSFVTLGEELDIVGKYLSILEIRYDTSFRLHLDIDPATENFRIPRMLIQPLVENAVFHGLVPTGNDGDIWIEAVNEPDAVLIEIRDNGRGIAPEYLLKHEEQEDDRSSGMTGIGLMHVHESIRLYYPAGSELRILKGETGGTIITMKLVKSAEAISRREGA
ncbi:sensor histidine kinase [Cohnella lupini]|uniref:Two-component system sensor histidine kinase YesM n=1 Tax=Cohnella lupini TaxID=1294267 RepID=A0A3D9IWP1_9BACL|nr:sensor histidine kinase [Cohnella lupini]RED65536.1 two-component system sensor histidine kinase YesM [Cohnella lupini]